MSSLDIHDEGPPRKVQRHDVGNERASKRLDKSIDRDSSFNFKNFIPSTSPDTFILDITKFIPVGCLRVKREKYKISPTQWNTCTGWAAFPHSKDLSNHRGGVYLSTELQKSFFTSFFLKSYVGLHNAGWIRLEFMSNDSDRGQIRVYILPDDVGRTSVDRNAVSLRKSMQSLLSHLDVSLKTWNGEWDEKTPLFHVDPSLDRDSRDEQSLFEVFYNLPSPKPDPMVVSDDAMRNVMYLLLESEVPGLITTMHMYQRRSAALMLQREICPGVIDDPRLTPQLDQDGHTWFCDIDAGLCFRDRRTYEAVRGGICAETMGLGKTLICLALILATRDFSSQIPLEYSVGSIPVRKATGSLLDMAAARIGRSGIPWKNDLARFEASEGYTFEQCREAIKKGAGHYFLPPPTPRRQSRHLVTIPPRKLRLCTTTIVVCPSNLVQQWRSEIKKHTTGLSVLYISSPRDKVPSAEELSEYDILLFSKLRFETELKEDGLDDYRSPLKDLHFKRLIVDEGHGFGNSNTKTMAVSAVESLQLSARWIVSGTPTQGLGAIDSSSQISSTEAISKSKNHADGDSPSSQSALESESPTLDYPSDASHQEIEFIKQERRNLEKLGNIATSFLQARPWANSPLDKDHASWSQLVMQPRHGSKSRGNMHTLKVTLEGMIVKHRPQDISDDVRLPPLHQKVVYLDGSFQNQLSLNAFSMMIISNAVTSERKDLDYFFHRRQRKNLTQLVSNLRQASFFWSGFESKDIRNTIDHAKAFLEEKKVPVTAADEALLLQAIMMGETILGNELQQAISKWHEMPMCIENELPNEVRSAWSPIGTPSNPTSVGATMVHAMQKFVDSQLWKPDPADGLLEAGQAAMEAAAVALAPAPDARVKAFVKATKKKKDIKAANKTNVEVPKLAGGVSVGGLKSPKKLIKAPSILPEKPSSSLDTRASGKIHSETKAKSVPSNRKSDKGLTSGNKSTSKLTTKPKSAMAKVSKFDEMQSIDPSSPLASTRLVSTASAKLSYLMDQILLNQEWEKIIIFYEADNVAYYIAQALECLGVKHLIYAKSLSSARRSQYVVTFNESETFRVLLMDVSQAAFGLNISTASRVYFVNPVFSPQIEAQAVKRAHRIGQTKPVYVETLVLKGSIEEVLIRRREAMSNEEHNKCKNILDDQTVYDWIRNVRFQPIPSNEVPIPNQMAKLETPQHLFGRGSGGKINDPDADLIMEEATPESKGKGREVVVEVSSPVPVPRKRKPQKKVTISLLSDKEDDSPNDAPKQKRKRVKIAEPEFVPLEVPQEAESSRNTQQRYEDNWEGLAFEDSDAELSV